MNKEITGWLDGFAYQCGRLEKDEKIEELENKNQEMQLYVDRCNLCDKKENQKAIEMLEKFGNEIKKSYWKNASNNKISEYSITPRKLKIIKNKLIKELEEDDER